jgi:hypothetical protein
MQSGQEGAACWRQLRSASPHGHSDKFPDTFIFALLALASVVLGALFVGATPSAIAVAFGDGFLESDSFHDANGYGRDHRSCRGKCAADRKTNQEAGEGTEVRPRSNSLHCSPEHDHVAVELGDERHRRRAAGA